MKQKETKSNEGGQRERKRNEKKRKEMKGNEGERKETNRNEGKRRETKEGAGKQEKRKETKGNDGFIVVRCNRNDVPQQVSVKRVEIKKVNNFVLCINYCVIGSDGSVRAYDLCITPAQRDGLPLVNK